jgi:hypothetical protein
MSHEKDQNKEKAPCKESDKGKTPCTGKEKVPCQEQPTKVHAFGAEHKK